MKSLERELRQKREQLIAKYSKKMEKGETPTAFHGDEELNQLLIACAKQRMERKNHLEAKAVGH